MRTWLRAMVLAGGTIGLAAAAAPAFAIGQREAKGVVEKIDTSDQRVVVRETGGRKALLPLAVAKDAKISTPSGDASLAALHVGDEVTVHYGNGPHGDEASQIQVTKAAPAK